MSESWLQDAEDKITYREILRCKNSVFVLVASMIAMICLIWMDPTLSVRLTNMGMSEDYVGIAFAMMGLSFGLGAAFAGWLCKKLSRLVVMQIGLLLLALSCFLVGPSLILRLPNDVSIILIGVSANAFFGAFLIVPVTPEIISAVGQSLK